MIRNPGTRSRESVPHERSPEGKGRKVRSAARYVFCRQAVQAMSCPQHNGDLIMPWSLGHFDT